MQKNGQKLSFTIINNGGFSDWVAAVNVIQTDLKAIGIQVTPKNLAAPAYQAAMYNGNYQLGYYARDRRARPRTTSCGSGCTRATPPRSASRPGPTSSGTATRRPTR